MVILQAHSTTNTFCHSRGVSIHMQRRVSLSIQERALGTCVFFTRKETAAN